MAGNGISVIVPFCGEFAVIERCLGAIRSGDFQPDQVILVNDGPDANLKALYDIGERFGVEVVTTEEKGSAARSRNFGARHAFGDILVFIDADVVIDKGTIASLCAPILYGESDATVGNYSDNVSGFNFFQAYKQLYIHQTYARGESNLEIFGEFWSAIGAVKASAFKEIGGFDENYLLAAGEDTELGRKLTEHRFRIFSVPNATGKHFAPMDFRRLIKNDLRKGIRTATDTFKKRQSFKNNRHTSGSNIAAVGFSVLFPTALLLSVIVGSVWGFLCATLLGFVYWQARGSLFRSLLKRGRLFASKGFCLQLILDWIRALSIVLGIRNAFRDYAFRGR